MTEHEIAETVIHVIEQTLLDKTGGNRDVTLQTPVDGRLGLDSLDWAAVVVQLESAIGVDPFAEGLDRELADVSDLVAVYIQASAKLSSR